MSSSAPTGDETQDGAQLNIARDRSTQYIVQHGNLYAGAAPSYRVDGFGTPRQDVPPSRLPAARYQVVDFIRREPELAALGRPGATPETGLGVRTRSDSGRGCGALRGCELLVRWS
ncbi:MAG TPA: hypothetical protein VHH34_12645 [Pseudonocardiaceae bacterium]|nr:hypothetical protein [Pseudonocardiaceae bacterium]